MPASSKAESAVRDYLEFIATSGPELGRAKSQVARATDPIVKLRALATVGRAQAIEAAFIENAQAFAAAERVPVDAWKQMGVPDSILAAAGLTAKGPGKPRKAAAKKTPAKKAATKKAATKRSAGQGAGKKASRGRSVPLELTDLVARLPKKPFKVREFAELIERPVATTRSYLDRLEKDGAVKVASLDSSGRGVPAKVYQRT